MMSQLTPELYVTDLEDSLAFYCGLLGFEIDYERPEESFACLKRGAVGLMLEEPVGRTWITATLERPFGRGVNFQIMIENVEHVYAKCLQCDAKIFVPLEHRSYRRRDEMVSLPQFVVQDPDGYLIRLAHVSGTPPNETDK